jgi:hypothetical protein
MYVPFILDTGLHQSNQNGYTLVKYKKPLKDYALGPYRSVIFKGTKLVCFSPPNSIPYNMFVGQHDEYIVEEFVEGTMINLFFDGEWHICTKSIIGARCSYKDTSPTFRDMFLAAFPFTFDVLDPSFVYSFVLQDPLNRIVTQFEFARVVLVAVYKIENNHVTEMPLDPRFDSPKRGASSKGVILRCGWDRAKQRNCDHEIASNLVNFPNSTLRDITLWQKEETNVFASYFPDQVDDLNITITNLNSLAAYLLKTYKQQYIYKRPCPSDMIPFTYEVHLIYLAMRPTGVSLPTVLRYLKGMHPRRLSNLLKNKIMT